MVVRRVSRVVPSDDEVTLSIRAANAGQPRAWIDEAVKAELDARHAVAAARQGAYDPAQPRELTRVTKPIEGEAGLSATYSVPKG